MRANIMRLFCLFLAGVVLAGMLPLAALAAAGTFTMTMREPEDNMVDVGDTVEIPVIVGHTGDISNYNSFDMRFAYDPSILELTTTAISGASVTVKNGTIRVLRYGSDLSVGAAVLTLSFKAIKPGVATVEAMEAKVGIKETAQEVDAADAVILKDVTVVVGGGSYTIDVAGTSGGTVSVSHSEAAAGERVAITVTPKSGYRLKTLIVTTASGKNVPVSTDNNGKYSFVMPAENVTVKAAFTAKSTASADTSNPKTGDDFNLLIWNTEAITSLMVLAVLLLTQKKSCRK